MQKQRGRTTYGTTRRDLAARNALAEQWVRLPYFVANRFRTCALVRQCGVDEAASELWPDLLRAAELWDETRATFSTFATSVLIRRLLGWAGRRRRQDQFEDATVPTDRNALAGAAAPDGEIDFLEVEKVRRALAELPGRERDVLQCCADEEPLADWARRHGVSKTRAQQLAARAKERLRALLTREDACAVKPV